MHGLLLSAEDWIVLGPEKGLGFILADAGYDVWFGNARGNIHSRKHVKYSPNWNGHFWNFRSVASTNNIMAKLEKSMLLEC